MSDNMRWRYGDTNPVVAAVDSATVIEIGDCVWQDVDNAKPASDQEHQISGLSQRATLKADFLGIAMQRSRPGDTAPIRVATTGVFEFECSSGTFELGDPMGVDFNLEDGKNLMNQRVGRASSAEAIGRVARREPTATTSVLVDIRSTVMTGGV